MELIEGVNLYEIRDLNVKLAKPMLRQCLEILIKLTKVSVIHGDYNEFNIMVCPSKKE